MSEKEQGENAPPLHPRCRCTICAAFDEGKRSAKVNGKRIKVPADTDYPTWWKKYVEERFNEKSERLEILRRQEIKNALDNNGVVKIHIDKTGEAHIPTAKLTQYALNPDKSPDKARAFEMALGYNLSNAEKLIENIERNINKFPIVEKPDTGYGKRFQIVMELAGENGKTAKVLTAWIIDKETDEVRLTTIYVDKK